MKQADNRMSEMPYGDFICGIASVDCFSQPEGILKRVFVYCFYGYENTRVDAHVD